MLYRSINVAILVLLSWFSYVSMQASKSQKQALTQIQQQLAQSHQVLFEKEQLSDDKTASFQKSFEDFLAVQQAQISEKKKLQSSVSAQKQIAGLHQLYSQVLKADVLRTSGKATEAASLLKSTKKQIWQTGDRHLKHQKALRSSMQTIDGLVKAWTAKETGQSAAPIYKALEKVLLDLKGK